MYTGTSKHSYSKKEGWKHSKERWDKNKTEAQEEQHQILHFWGSWWNRLGLTLGSSTAPAQLSVAHVTTFLSQLYSVPQLPSADVPWFWHILHFGVSIAI